MFNNIEVEIDKRKFDQNSIWLDHFLGKNESALFNITTVNILHTKYIYTTYTTAVLYVPIGNTNTFIHTR